MAVMILSAREFSLRSTWTGTETGGAVRYTTPSLAREYVSFSVSQLPRGAVVRQAILRVTAYLGYTGGRLTINGAEGLARDVTDLIVSDSAGNYPDLTLAFAFRANGGQGGAGSHVSVTQVRSAVITVTYEPGDSAAADTKAAVWRAASAPSRDLRPFASLRFPDGAEQALGPGEILSFRLDEGCEDGPLLGQAPAAVLSLRLANAAHEWYPGGSLRGDRALLGATLALRMRVQTDIGPVQVPLGSFVIDEMRGDEQDAWLELRGFDGMANALEAVWTDTAAYPALLSDILANIAAAAGLGVEGVLACNRDRVISRKPDWGENCTLRSALMQVCAAGGSFARVTRSGLLGIAPAYPDYGEALRLTPAHVHAPAARRAGLRLQPRDRLAPGRDGPGGRRHRGGGSRFARAAPGHADDPEQRPADRRQRPDPRPAFRPEGGLHRRKLAGPAPDLARRPPAAGGPRDPPHRPGRPGAPHPPGRPVPLLWGIRDEQETGMLIFNGSDPCVFLLPLRDLL